MERIGVQAVVEDADSYFNTMKKINQTVTDFAKTGADAGVGFGKGFGDIVTGALREVGAMAVHALGDAAKAVGSFIKDSVGVAGDFEAGMNKFQVVAGKGVDTTHLKQFRDLFIQLGRELPVSTSEVEDAATEMVSGGIDPAIVAAGGLRQTLNFAAASGLSLADAAQTSAKFLAGWTSSSATAAQQVAFLTLSTDTLTKAAAASSTTAAELRLGLFNVQGAAQELHVTFQDTTATLALLAPAFQSSAQAGTALSVFMTRLVPATRPATDAMEAMGIITKKGQNIFFDAKGNFLGMANAAQVLKTKLGGLTDAQKIATLHTLFGDDAQKVANLLMQDGAAGLDGMIAKMNAASGVSEAAATMQQGYNVALENAKGSVEALQITVGSYLLPVLTDLINNTIAPAINTLSTFATALFGDRDAFNSLSLPLQGIVTYTTSVVKAFEGWYNGTLSLKTALDVTYPGLGKLVDLAQELNSFLTENITTIEAVVGALGTFVILTTVAGWVGTLSAAVTTAAAAFAEAGGGIEAVVAILGGPVTLAIAGVAAAIGVLYVAWTNDWGGIQEKAAAAWEAIQPALSTLTTWLETNIPRAIAVASDYFNKNIFPVLKSLADTYLTAASAELKLMADVWTNVVGPALSSAWVIMRDDIIPVVKALVDVHIAALKLALTAMAGIWQKEVQPALKAANDYISANLGPTLKNIGDWLSNTFGPVLKNVNKWLGDVTGGFKGIGDAAGGVAKKIEDFATSISTLKLPPWATPGSPTPWEIALRGIGDALSTEVIPGVNAFGSSLTGMGAAAGSAAADITGNLSAALKGTDVVGNAKSLGKNVIAGLVSGIEANMKAIDKVANKVGDKIDGSFSSATKTNSPSGVTIPYGASLIEGLLVGMQTALPGLSGVINGVGDVLRDKFKQMSADTADQIDSLVKGIQDTIKQAQSDVSDLIASGFTSTAGISRQVADNLGNFKDVKPSDQASVSAALKAAEQTARAMQDPAQGEKYFKDQSDHIFELAALRKNVADQQQAINDNFDKQADTALKIDQQRSLLAIAATDAERQAILDKITALNAEADAQMAARHAAQDNLSIVQQQATYIASAQNDENAAGDITRASATNPFTELANQLRDILNNNLTVGGKTAEIPGIDDATVRGIGNLINALATTYAPVQQQSQAQYYTNAPVNNYNLGIQTNQSPAVVQQSFAIMGAGLG